MIRYTTPAIPLTIEGKDITAHDIYVTFEQGSLELTKTGTDLVVSFSDPDTLITVTLTQEETAAFSEAPVTVQVNWITSSGVRGATVKKTISVHGNLLEEVLAYGQA